MQLLRGNVDGQVTRRGLALADLRDWGNVLAMRVVCARIVCIREERGYLLASNYSIQIMLRGAQRLRVTSPVPTDCHGTPGCQTCCSENLHSARIMY